jgi:hypothetical protein
MISIQRECESGRYEKTLENILDIDDIPNL